MKKMNLKHLSHNMFRDEAQNLYKYDMQSHQMKRMTDKDKLKAHNKITDINKENKTNILPVKFGDTVKDYDGRTFKVIKVSKDFDDVKEYDDTGAGEDNLDMEKPDEIYVAVKNKGGIGYIVYVYGEDGVTKVSS